MLLLYRGMYRTVIKLYIICTLLYSEYHLLPEIIYKYNIYIMLLYININIDINHLINLHLNLSLQVILMPIYIYYKLFGILHLYMPLRLRSTFRLVPN